MLFQTGGKTEKQTKQTRQTFVESCGFQGKMSFSQITPNFTENVTPVRS